MTGEPSISDRGTEEEVKVNFLYRGVDWALDWQRGQLSMELHGRVAASIPKVSGTLPLFTVLGLLVVWGLHQLADTGLGHFWALGVGASSVVAGYFGHRFTRPCLGAMDSNPVRVSTRAYFDVFSICLTIMVLGISLGGVGLLVQAVSGEELAISMLWFGLLGYASVLLLAYFLLTIFLHPSLLNVEIDPNQTAGGDFIGYESFGLKLILQGVVFLPTVLVVCGLVLAGTVGTEDMVFLEHGMLYILAGLLYPMIAYFVHLLLNLPLEVLHNILSIRASRPHVVSPGMERSPVGASGENLIEELRSLGSEFGATDSSPDGG